MNIPLHPYFKSLSLLLLSLFTLLESSLRQNSICLAADHRESPALLSSNVSFSRIDATDFYLFTGYETDAEDTVVLIANYQPYQNPSAGPVYYPLDPNSEYFIHIDNNGDAVEDLSFRFTFQTEVRNQSLEIGGQDIPIPFLNRGPLSIGQDSNLNAVETYKIDLIRGDLNSSSATPFPVMNAATGSDVFGKPVDNIGQKSIPNYPAYAQSFIQEISLPGTEETGTVFVGQREDPFYANLGGLFDLANLNLTGPPDGGNNTFAGSNVTAIVLELPPSFLTVEDPVIGGWTTARTTVPQGGNGEDINGDGVVDPLDLILLATAFRRNSRAKAGTVEPPTATVQVSRLGHPMIKMMFMGYEEKDSFNSSLPRDDIQFLNFITNPVLPQHLAFLFGFQPPTQFPRQDLRNFFTLGIDGLNLPANCAEADILRLNTSTPPKGLRSQNPLGVIGGDTAGYPNGRRPADDVVDIILRAAMGARLTANEAPDGQLAYTDGVSMESLSFPAVFPYLNNPAPGSRN